MHGKVKWFHNGKGWGFIEAPNLPDVFVHYSNIVLEGFKKLREGQQVQFELADEGKGPFAKNVIVEEVQHGN